MKIEDITVAGLRERLGDRAFWDAPVLPVTRQRALSYVANPRARDEDVVLMVATEGECVAGYLGVLPDRCFLPAGETRLGWLTPWWVEPEHRRSGAAAVLLARALKHYEGSLAVPGFSPEARRVYEASGRFVPLREMIGARLMLRLRMRRVVRRRAAQPPSPALRLAARFAVLLDAAAGTAAGPRLRAWRRREVTAGFSPVEYVSAVDSETEELIAEAGQHDFSRRGRRELDWIAASRVVLTAPLPDRTQGRYRFSSAAPLFVTMMVKVFDSKDRLVGFAVLTLRDGHLRAPHAWWRAGRQTDVARVIGLHAAVMDCDLVSLFDPDLLRALGDAGFPALRRQPAADPFIIGKVHGAVDFQRYRLHDGEGDRAFS